MIIRKKIKNLNNGGVFLIPLPIFKIINKDNYIGTGISSLNIKK